jgi:glycosyltransferase involved in cell wall biosynthesis
VHLEPFAARQPRPADLDAAIKPGEYALFLGRLAHRKGVDVLLRALAQVACKGKVQLVVAGQGEERAALESLAAELAIAKRVRFVGPVAGAMKMYLLQNARFLVTPTRTWEGLPLSVLEGFAAARCQVATSVPGIIDLVVDGQTGWLSAPESPEALAAALREAFADPAKAYEMGCRAQTVASRYGWDSVAGAHLQLYERLASPAKGCERYAR